MSRFGSSVQLKLFDDGPTPFGVEGTFRPNHEIGVHRWYPYLEGFSHSFVSLLMDEFGSASGKNTLYEPFAGSGTTPTVAAFRGEHCRYSEINPFMRLVVETKTNVVRAAYHERTKLLPYLTSISKTARRNLPSLPQAKEEFAAAFGERPYFGDKQLREVIALRAAIADIEPHMSAFRDLARLALGAIAVGSSTLKRAGDLRYRTRKEQVAADHSPIQAFDRQCASMCDDLSELLPPQGVVDLVSPSALDPIAECGFADLVITSPPYLNGTNYIRNAKLELWLTGFLSSEKELTVFRREALTAGICDVIANGRKVTPFEFIEDAATALDEVTYDRRIPQMVRRYFSDSELWLNNVSSALKPGGRAVIDIGDSRFAGIHIPTDRGLALLGEAAGLTLIEERFVRARKSKDGSELKQVLLIFDKPCQTKAASVSRELDKKAYKQSAEEFSRSLPHKAAPYASRNWGNNLHSLCSYQGKLKPAIAHFLVREFTSPGDRVLDPLSGSGAIPLEATLQGRQALANDLQELAHLLSSAKVKVGEQSAVWGEYENLVHLLQGQPAEGSDVDFGFNGTIREYFHADTLREILIAREFLISSLGEGLTWERAFVLSAFAHLLHGNRPYALSRRSHPVTPLKPQGLFEYRPAAPRLKEKIARALEAEPSGVMTTEGSATLGDFRSLSLKQRVDAVITSPPFHDSTRFYIANWMRLWFCGWDQSDFQTRKHQFLETQQKQSMSVYRDFFAKCAEWLRPGGKLIMHVGRVKGFDMSAEIQKLMPSDFDFVHSADESVSGAESFGLSDQGATDTHQYLFLIRN